MAGDPKPYATVRVEHDGGVCRVHGPRTCYMLDGAHDLCPGPDTYALVPLDKLPRWIPVEERPPESDGQYHVFAVAPHCPEGWESQKEFTRVNGFYTIGTVTHWLDGMPPLPTPPEAKP